MINCQNETIFALLGLFTRFLDPPGGTIIFFHENNLKYVFLSPKTTNCDVLHHELNEKLQ